MSSSTNPPQFTSRSREKPDFYVSPTSHAKRIKFVDAVGMGVGRSEGCSFCIQEETCLQVKRIALQLKQQKGVGGGGKESEKENPKGEPVNGQRTCAGCYIKPN